MPIKSLLKPEIQKWFEKSAEAEFKAHFTYQHIANQLQRVGLFGGQKYFIHESNEEMAHYRKLSDFVNDMGGVLSVPSVSKISDTIVGFDSALSLAYKLEVDLMKQYQTFYEEAEESGDCITSTFLIEFMQIQRKSVGEFGDLIARYEQNKTDVFEFDEYVGELVK